MEITGRAVTLSRTVNILAAVRIGRTVSFEFILKSVHRIFPYFRAPEWSHSFPLFTAQLVILTVDVPFNIYDTSSSRMIFYRSRSFFSKNESTDSLFAEIPRRKSVLAVYNRRTANA